MSRIVPARGATSKRRIATSDRATTRPRAGAAETRRASPWTDLPRALLAGVLVAAVVAVVWTMWWVLVAVVVPGWSPVVISSGSMAPGIRAGDVVVAGAVGPELLTEGAVIVFRDDHYGLVTHRIAGVADDGTLRTKGDTNATEDSDPVAVEDVVGRGRLLLPVIGRPLLWIHAGRWLPLAALLVGGVGAVGYLASWWRWTGSTVVAASAAEGAPDHSETARRRVPTEREMQLISFAWGKR